MSLKHSGKSIKRYTDLSKSDFLVIKRLYELFQGGRYIDTNTVYEIAYDLNIDTKVVLRTIKKLRQIGYIYPIKKDTGIDYSEHTVYFPSSLELEPIKNLLRSST